MLKIEWYLDHLVSIVPEVSPVQLLARDAAAADPAAAEVWAQMRQEMLMAMTYFSAELLDTGQVKPGLGADDVRDILWTYHGPEQYELLCLERGWPPERYGKFLRDAMVAAVLA